MKQTILILFFSSFIITGCSSMHDGKGWEHEGAPSTQEDSTPFQFEHKH